MLAGSEGSKQALEPGEAGGQFILLSPRTGRCSDPEEGLERRYAGCFENLINNDFLKLYKR